jgi:ribosomal protein S18 acetylase RimI-like enzyme
MMDSSFQAIRFREITSTDTEADYAIYRSTREEELSRSGWAEDDRTRFVLSQYALQRTQYRQMYLNASFQLIFVGDSLAGRFFANEADSEIRIIDLALLPQWRNRGIGTAILTDVIERARAAGKKVTIHVEINNPARALYERLGFAIVEPRGMHYFMECVPSPRLDAARS